MCSLRVLERLCKLIEVNKVFFAFHIIDDNLQQYLMPFGILFHNIESRYYKRAFNFFYQSINTLSWY